MSTIQRLPYEIRLQIVDHLLDTNPKSATDLHETCKSFRQHHDYIRNRLLKAFRNELDRSLALKYAQLVLFHTKMDMQKVQDLERMFPLKPIERLPGQMLPEFSLSHFTLADAYDKDNNTFFRYGPVNRFVEIAVVPNAKEVSLHVVVEALRAVNMAESICEKIKPLDDATASYVTYSEFLDSWTPDKVLQFSIFHFQYAQVRGKTWKEYSRRSFKWICTLLTTIGEAIVLSMAVQYWNDFENMLFSSRIGYSFFDTFFMNIRDISAQMRHSTRSREYISGYGSLYGGLFMTIEAHSKDWLQELSIGDARKYMGYYPGFENISMGFKCVNGHLSNFHPDPKPSLHCELAQQTAVVLIQSGSIDMIYRVLTGCIEGTSSQPVAMTFEQGWTEISSKKQMWPAAEEVPLWMQYLYKRYMQGYDEFWAIPW